ncbi:MAG: Ig-like domain-containing protein [Gemmatimonadaceae bacterium]
MFPETALAASASGITIVAGAGQSARILSVLSPFVVRVTDDGGNPVANVTVTRTATNGTLASAATKTDATGQASNTMTLGTVAGTASAVASVPGRSATFSVTVLTGIVAKIEFKTNAPASGESGVSLSPPVRVALEDVGGNQTAATNLVSIALSGGPTGAALTGTLTRAAVAGIATFDDLKIDKTGSGYTLVASSAGVSNITSTPITVGFGAPGRLMIVSWGTNRRTERPEPR